MVDNKENIEACEKSDRIKTILAVLVLNATEDGVLVLDPPYTRSGVDIKRIVAKTKHGKPLAKFQVQLGGDGHPSYRLALFTDTRFSDVDGDLSFKQKWWDCFPDIYQALLEYARAYVNRPPVEEKKRR